MNRTTASLLACLVLLNSVPAFAADKAESDAGADKSGASALQRMSDFYASLKSMEAKVDLTLAVSRGGDEKKTSTVIDFAAQKPNRFAIRRQGFAFGPTVVSDGTIQTTYLPTTNIYIESSSPDSIGGGMVISTSMMVPQSYDGFLLLLASPEPGAEWAAEGSSVRLLGEVDLEGQPADHLRGEIETVPWEAWIAKGEEPWLLKLQIDLTEFMNGEEGDYFHQILIFRDWKKSVVDEAKSFTFVPPKGAVINDNLLPFSMAGMTEAQEEEPSPLLGKPAPAIQLPLLDGGKFDLAEEQEKHIVMLDFWATWCGPCVREMPVLSKVAQDYADKGVVLYCLNQQEEKETIEKFLKEEKLSVTVALDAESAAGDAYGVSGIPMLVLIDKKGVVQSVHVGFSPDLETTLKQELDAILEGKDLAAETLAARQSQMDIATLKPDGLEEVWSKRGRYSGLATAADGKIYANQGGSVTIFNMDGDEAGSVELAEGGRTIRLARRSAEPNSDQLISFDHWGDRFSATSPEGQLLWSVKLGQGVDDVAAADLNGDGSDEIIVGYNGGTGLHVFDSSGNPKWKDTSIGNVWTVTAGDVNGDGGVEVVTTSAGGTVHLFESDGKAISTFRPIMYSHTVRVGKLANQEKATIFVIGTGKEEPAVAASDEDGTPYWSLSLAETSKHCSAASLTVPAGFLAASFNDGTVYVLDAKSGKTLGTLSGQARTADVAWALSEDHAKPFLLVANGSSLAAYRIVEQSVDDSNSEAIEQE